MEKNDKMISVLSPETKPHKKVYSQLKKQSRALKLWQVRARVDVEHGTHLTIDWGRNVHSGNTQNHAQKSGHTCEGVDLPNQQISPNAERGK